MGAGVNRRRDGSAGSGGRVSTPVRRDELLDLVAPFGGTVFCHVPAERPFDAPALARPDDGRDRWGTPGERTIFLAADPAIALAEYARHRSPNGPSDDRRIVSVRLNAVRVLDVRTPAVAEVLASIAADQRLVDRESARAIAAAIRASGVCQGLLVPSMAFLDRPERFNVVLFAEHLGRDVGELVADPADVGRISLAGR